VKRLLLKGEKMLSEAVRRWIAASVGAAARLDAVRSLAGATSATLYAIDVTHRGRALPLVLRLFTNRAWLAEEPDLARHEAAALRMAAAAAIPTPELVACDATGEACGVPAILMTRLPGRVILLPEDMDTWLRGLADVAATLHAIAAPAFPWRYRPYNDLAALEVPDWSAQPDLWRRALAIIKTPVREEGWRFIHRDYHPVNILWDAGQPGIVDWPNACRGPLGADLGHCRANLALLHSPTIADRFLAAYRAATGAALDDQPYRDLLALADMFLPGPPEVYFGWTAHGVAGLTDRLMLQRVEAYLAGVLARL
jgi:aminoglycoside phosphotransferase (APT) family kinase protein